jgi:arylsulfatase A-like enzyme
MTIRKKTFAALGLIVPFVSAPMFKSDKAPAEKPNVIFILLDDFGYTDLGCYGSKYYETPNIDRLASNAFIFTDAYAACPVCSPSRASIMTGKYPVNTGITDWIPGRQATNSGSPTDKLVSLPFKQQLDLNELTIAEVLKKNGYRTMISGKWHLGGDQKFWPENQGFDVNKGGYSAGAPVRNKESNGYFAPYGNPRLEDGPVGEYLTDRQTDEAIKFMENNKDNPFFLYLPYYAVHNPMQGKEKLIERFTKKADSLGLTNSQVFTRDKDWIRKNMSDNFKERIIQSNPVYAAMIASVDENIGRLLEKLVELNIDKNTIIFFTSDNGGLSTSEGSPTCNAPLRAGKGWLYEGGIRVPLIVRVPGKSNPGSLINTPVCSIDYFSTIAEMTGSETGDIKTDGVSFVSLLKKDKMKARPLFWHYPHYSNQGVEPGSAVRMGNYKLIDNFEKGRLELYDLSNDISEKHDISSSNTEKVKELYNMLIEWRTRTGAKMMEPNPKWIGSK